MIPRQYIILLLVLITSPLSKSQACLNLKVKIPDSICDCDYLEDANGWLYTCIESTTLDNILELKYIVDHSIEFTCGNNESYYESISQNLNLTKIQRFVFKSCPLPLVSYGEVLRSYDDYPLQEIRVLNTRDNRSFTAELFEPISENLKVLVLNNNAIKELPETIFANFTKLQTLYLSDNKLKTLPEKVFHHLSQLTILEITNNELESLPENLFQNLFQLKSLYLYKNKLRRLPKNVFQSLPSLEVLDLTDNKLLSLPSDIFLGLSQLKHIRLRGNWFRTLPKELFHYSSNLQVIDLSINRFMEPLPEIFLSGLTKLESFIAVDCNITFLHEQFFTFTPNITHINLQNNGLVSLFEPLFINNTLLKELNLNFNFIKELPPNLLKNHKQLEKLFLYRNNITFIPDKFFEVARALRTLVLGSNYIQIVTQDMFRDLPSLESVDLSKNNLSYFKLDLNKEIRYIDLSSNNLTEMPDIEWLNHLKLESLSLEYNKLTTFVVPILYTVSHKSPSINVSHNKIKTVNVLAADLYDKNVKELDSDHFERNVETKIALHDNPFVCNCSLYGFFKYLKGNNESPKRSAGFDMIQKLTCHEPSDFEGKAIVDMNPSYFRCTLTENCSSQCHCYITAQDDSRTVNCSGMKLKSLPHLIPYNTSILHFQNNFLPNVSGFHNHQWDNLTEIYLDHNLISSLSNWKVPLKLKALSLRGNRIRELPISLLNFTSSIKGFHMNLSSNPWTCNCSTLNFKQWLVENFQMVQDANKILCGQRQKQNGTLVRMSILTLPDEEMCPLDDWPYRVQIITVATVCAILALSLFVVSVLYYRNKQTVIAYLYIHVHPFFICFFSEEDIDEDKVFDAFVAYGHDDADVAHKLIEELEPHFQLCIHERNWIAGNQISWNIFNSVHNSRRTILVISKEFLESMWFQVEFHTAYYQMLEDKIDRLIIIVKGDLPPKETLDKELLYLLSTKTYLIWGERWFWEKLRYAMPHKKQQPLQSNMLALKDKPDSEKIKAVENQIAIQSANCNKATEKVQEVVQNGTNRALSLVNKENLNKK